VARKTDGLSIIEAVGGHIVQILSGAFARYGYWTVAFGMLLESAGVPVPGETILLFASFLAYSKHQLDPPVIVLIGVMAATFGDNLGYCAGRFGGRRLLERYKHVFHVSSDMISRGERLFERHGALAVFFARFVAGLRVVAGPLAGVLHMRWRRFLVFNFLGAATWVTVIVTVGYLFGSEFQMLLSVFGRAGILLLAAVAVAAVAAFWWSRRRKERAD
jgi:membrane protein DedA with SNARE-associated domain